MHKLMLDANTFDFIYDNDSSLVPKLEILVNSNKLSLYMTHIQRDEIEKIGNIGKRHRIKEIIKLIKIQTIVTSNAFVGTDFPSKHGYNGSRIGMSKVVNDNDASMLEKLQKKTTNPMGNTADLSILYTAIKENMDYLITNDLGYKNLLIEMSKSKPNKLAVKPNSSLLTDF
jgi:rRNA-processing protein FCF1